jgi:hypothetical protein
MSLVDNPAMDFIRRFLVGRWQIAATNFAARNIRPISHACANRIFRGSL